MFCFLQKPILDYWGTGQSGSTLIRNSIKDGYQIPRLDNKQRGLTY